MQSTLFQLKKVSAIFFHCSVGTKPQNIDTCHLREEYSFLLISFNLTRPTLQDTLQLICEAINQSASKTKQTNNKKKIKQNSIKWCTFGMCQALITLFEDASPPTTSTDHKKTSLHFLVKQYLCVCVYHCVFVSVTIMCACVLRDAAIIAAIVTGDCDLNYRYGIVQTSHQPFHFLVHPNFGFEIKSVWWWWWLNCARRLMSL